MPRNHPSLTLAGRSLYKAVVAATIGSFAVTRDRSRNQPGFDAKLLRVAVRQVLERFCDVAQGLPDLAQLVAVVSGVGLGPAARDPVDEAGYGSQLPGDSLKGLHVRCFVRHGANLAQPWGLVSTRG